MPKPKTALPDTVSDAVKDFVRCRSNTLELSPGDHPWLPGGMDVDLGFEDEPTPGSVKITVGGLVMPITINASVVDGQLVTDVEGFMFGSQISEWTANLNADLKANGMQMSDLSLRNGKLHFTKVKIVATPPAGESGGSGESGAVTTPQTPATLPPVTTPPPATTPPPTPPLDNSGWFSSCAGLFLLVLAAISVAIYFAFFADGTSVSVPDGSISEITDTGSERIRQRLVKRVRLGFKFELRRNLSFRLEFRIGRIEFFQLRNRRRHRIDVEFSQLRLGH